jgi:hypothetical protein
MLTSPDFKELLSILAKHEVRYLVVGGRDQDKLDVKKLRKAGN